MKAYQPKLTALQSQISNLKSEIDATMPAGSPTCTKSPIKFHSATPAPSSTPPSAPRNPGSSPTRVSSPCKKASPPSNPPPPNPPPSPSASSPSARPPGQTRLMIRGDFLRPDQAVAPATLAILHPLKLNSPPSTQNSGPSISPLPPRPGPLARRPRQPAHRPRRRQRHLARTSSASGLVETANDFGVRGEQPTPSRIARLAGHRVPPPRTGAESAHRTIVTSARPIANPRASAPELARHRSRESPASPARIASVSKARSSRPRPRRRRPALDKIGGPSVFPPLRPTSPPSATPTTSSGRPAPARTATAAAMYTFFKRTAPTPA